MDRYVMTVEEIADPELAARLRRQAAQFRRNREWLALRTHEVCSQHRGRHVAVAGEELFVADTSDQALSEARAAHPGDEGVFVRHIPSTKMQWIYANRRRVV